MLCNNRRRSSRIDRRHGISLEKYLEKDVTLEMVLVIVIVVVVVVVVIVLVTIEVFLVRACIWGLLKWLLQRNKIIKRC